MCPEKIALPGTATTEDLLAVVNELNARESVDGILVQLPLPPHVDARRILAAVSPEKDIDGLHPFNVGCLVARQAAPRPCTPAGVIQLLKRYRIGIAGKRAVVVGRSDLVGKPTAVMLLHEDATVTVCHSKTQDLAAVCSEADILVVAAGRPALITADAIKPGATVIDVGINSLEKREDVSRIFRNSTEKLEALERKGSVLVGDVDPVAVEKSGAYTPVPGGVGPLTIAMLMANTVESAERRLGLC